MTVFGPPLTDHLIMTLVKDFQTTSADCSIQSTLALREKTNEMPSPAHTFASLKPDPQKCTPAERGEADFLSLRESVITTLHRDHKNTMHDHQRHREVA